MHNSRLFLVALVSLLLSHGASAVCSRNEPGYLWNFVGDLSKDLRIKMTLVFSGTELKGRYVYASALKDIELKGHVKEGREVVVDELDADGQVTGQFVGQFVEQDPRRIYGDSRLECEVMVGTWQKRGSAQKRPFYVHSVDATAGSLSRRYGLVGAANDDLINRNAQRFWEGVKRGDKTAVAQQVRYPIKVTMGKRLNTLRSAAEFVKQYDTLITPSTRAAIIDDIPRYMFVRDEGIMLANGIVWFGADGKVISLMPLP
jgi:hypothetical protein